MSDNNVSNTRIKLALMALGVTCVTITAIVISVLIFFMLFFAGAMAMVIAIISNAF